MTIFSPKASLPSLAAARLQRLVITLSAFHYDNEFCPTAKHANADSLSQLPLDSISTAEIDNSTCLFNIQFATDCHTSSRSEAVMFGNIK